MSALQVPSFEGGRGTELPAGWVRWVDPATDEYYYHNEETGETTWDDPTRWKVGLWLDRARGVGGGPEVDDRPPYEPRSIEHAFSQWCASEGGATSFDDDEEEEDDDDDDAAGGAYPVTLHVYDVKFRGAALLNGVLNRSSGAFHTAVEVHGLEWSFGATMGEQNDACGIFACGPKSARPHVYAESVPLGSTKRSRVDVFNCLLRIAPLWAGCTYDVFRKNCNSFCIVLAGELGADPPPAWTHRLGDGAAALDDRARRLYANLQGGPEAPEPSGPSVIVWDDHGAWHARHYDTTEEAKAAWDDLPLSHASVLFVKDARSSRDVGTADTDSDGDDDPAWAWQPLRQYGMPHAVRKIRDRFANSRALRRGGRQPTERQAKKLLRPKRRALSETVAPPTP